MPPRCGHGSLAICLALALGATAPAAARQPAACTGVPACRAETESAIAQGDFERAHDLAWRTVQQGPRNDRALMFLLARTQALSNRPDDALVMIRRLAELGAIVDVSTDEFARLRELPGWPAVETVIAGIANPPVTSPPPPPPPPPAPVAPKVAAPAPKASPALVAPVAPVAPLAPLAPVAPVVPVLVEEAGHFTSSEFAPGGLTCDAVSKRFVFGDRTGRKLLVVAEGSDHAIDLTRADVAGFLDVTALDIDTTNGNLWVASAEADGRGATLHRVQLISGRPIASFAVPETLAPVMPLDVAVASAGVLLLDSLQHRLLILRPGSTAVAVLAELGEVVPLSLTASRQDSVAYVTHRDGLLAIDLKTRSVAAVTASKTVVLGGIERLRRHGGGFVGVQALPDGTRRVVRLTLDARGRTVTRLRLLDVSLPVGPEPIPLAVCGNTLGYLVGEPASATAAPNTTWTIRRIQLNP
jgi:hypothetical protein